MSNMSYCRFQNTLADLRDCYLAMCEEQENDWSEDEQKAFKSMLKLCKKIASDYED